MLEFLQKYNCLLWKANTADSNTNATTAEEEGNKECIQEEVEEEEEKEEETFGEVEKTHEEGEHDINPSLSPKQLSRKQRKEAKKAVKNSKKNGMSGTVKTPKKKVKKNPIHYDILSEEEYLKQERNPCYGEEDDCDDECPLPSEEELQAITVPANPYAAFVLNEEEGVKNFDTALLLKSTI